jgi:hypothetical protein
MKRSSANQFPSLSPNDIEDLLAVLRVRFHKHMSRHADCTWELIEEALRAQPEKLWSIAVMERTGGKPDVIGKDDASGEYLFVDCSAESPIGRTATCYDREAQMSRKEHQPAHNAVDLAAAMGVSLLTEAEYFLRLRKFGNVAVRSLAIAAMDALSFITMGPSRITAIVVFAPWFAFNPCKILLLSLKLALYMQ